MILALALASALAAIAVSPASAAFRHPVVTGSFGSDGTPATTIGGLDQLAYDQSADRLYAYGRSPSKIYGFDTATQGTQTPLGGFPINVVAGGGDPDVAVDNSPSSAGNFYYLTEGSGLYGFNSAGGPLSGFPVGGFQDSCGAATDGEGNIWVGDYGAQAVKKFSSSGTPLGSIDVSAAGQPCHITFDRSNDNLFVALYGGSTYEFKASDGYSSPTLIAPGATQALTVDASSHTLYVAHPNEVVAYNESGALLETFATSVGSINGITVDEARGIVYVANESKIQVIPGVVVPDAETGSQTGDATVNGHVDPAGGGNITDCYFEFGTDTEYGQTKACDQATPISTPTDVSANLSGEVLGETEYHYRVVVSNANGTSFGADQTFTPHFVSGLVTDPATAVGKNTATLNGHFIGTDESTSYYFEWGTTTAYGNTSATPPGDPIGSTTGNTPLAFDASGLLPGTLYHYRVVATNPKGTSPGNDQTFTTVAAVAGLTTGPPTEVTGTSAKLHGTWTGEGDPITCHFEWGYSDAYGNSTPELPVASDPGPQSTTVELTGLSPVTTFHYEIVCTNSTGPAYGGDQSLATIALPAVAVKPPSGYSTTGVTLNGTVGPQNGGATTYHFDYGTTAAYGSSTPESASVGSGFGTFPASAELEGLEPGTDYHYRLVATSPAGIKASEDRTLTTVPLLPSIGSASSSEVTPSTVTLSASVNPGFGPTVVVFDYGTGPSYGTRTLPTEPSPDDGSDHLLSTDVTGLTPGTTYHYRAVAINFNGVAEGPDQTFSTPSAPKLSGTGSEALTDHSARLIGSVQSGFLPTTYRFEYGPSSDYGFSTAVGNLGADNLAQPVSADVAGLLPETTYHFRLVASNGVGTSTGPDLTFTTAPMAVADKAPAPKLTCKKGFVKRKGRCVRKHRSTKKKGKKHA